MSKLQKLYKGVFEDSAYECGNGIPGLEWMEKCKDFHDICG